MPIASHRIAQAAAAASHEHCCRSRRRPRRLQPWKNTDSNRAQSRPHGLVSSLASEPLLIGSARRGLHDHPGHDVTTSAVQSSNAHPTPPRTFARHDESTCTCKGTSEAQNTHREASRHIRHATKQTILASIRDTCVPQLRR
jgi:hypothetical protein